MRFDNQLMAPVALALLTALVVSFLMTPVVKSFAYKVGAIDVPKDERRMHHKPIPRLGGLAIFAGFMASILLFVDIRLNPQMQSILLGAVIIVVLGVVDDIMALPAKLKFVIQIAAALIPALNGVSIQALSNPNIFSPNAYWVLNWLSVPVTVLWIVGITNAVNLIDGLDGLANGVSAISAATVLVIALITSDAQVAVVMAALVGACVGFLPYNLNPAKMFMGDTGATFLGFILSTMSIQGLFKFYAVISFAVPFLILGLPIFDTAFAMIRRMAHGQSPMHADRGHIHHRLIDMGLNQKQAVATLYVISGILGLSAVVLTTGGFGANLDMVVKYKPELKGFMTTNAAGIQGQGIEMAEAIGAATVDMDQIQIHPTVEANTAALITEGLRGDGAVLINAEGKRFIDEVGTRDVVSAAEIAQTGSYSWLVVDQAMTDNSSVIQGYIKKGYTVTGATYEELAKAMGVDEAALAETMNNWNGYVEAKNDPDFGRTSFANPLNTAPYYAIKVTAGVHHTMGGLKINPNTEVLNENGEVIPGLFAAGEVTGGVHGANRLGGNAVADFTVFGRIAGAAASNYAA